MPTEEEIKKIIDLYDNGKGLSHGQIAKKLNYNQSTITRTINKWLGKDRDAEGNAHESPHQCKTKNAIEAKSTYDRERRLALNDKLFKRLEEFIDNEKITAQDFKAYLISYGILEDKRSLIEQLQTGNEKDLLTKFTEALDNHAISAQTSRCVPGLPEDPPNPDVRVSEKRKD